MDWFELSDTHTLSLEDDLFQFGQDIHLDNNEINTLALDENSLSGRTYTASQPPTDTFHWDEPNLFHYSDLTSNGEENCLNEVNDTHSSESSCQLSNFGSDSNNLNYVDRHMGCSASEVGFLSEISKSQKRDPKSTSSSEDGIDTTRHNKNASNDRRSYALGNSYSKNAIAARDNRLKKKKYVSSLEESIKNLRTENEYLLEKYNKTSHTVSGLQKEVFYLRGVIANQSGLSAILKNVIKTPGIKLSTSFNCLTQSSNQLDRRLPTDGSNNTLEQNVTGKSACVQTGPVNYIAQSSQNPIPSINSITNSEKCVKRNQEREKIRMRCDKAKKKDITVDNSKVSSSSVSFTQDDDIDHGICLHITKESISLELCSHCNMNANLGIMLDHSYVKQ